MKEFKASENIEKDKLVENVDKKFEEDLKEIKDKLNAEKLSDEFKENLQAKLEEELNKDTSKSKGKILQFPVITRKLAGICACFVLLFSGCFAFADDIENVIFKIFGDTDRIIENAIANGNYKEINMDYVENNGVSIKVDYVVVEDDNLYIAFNVFTEKEYDKVFLDGIKIADSNKNLIYSNEYNSNNAEIFYKENKININNSILTCRICDFESNLDLLNELEITINLINMLNKSNFYEINGEWKIKI